MFSRREMCSVDGIKRDKTDGGSIAVPTVPNIVNELGPDEVWKMLRHYFLIISDLLRDSRFWNVL